MAQNNNDWINADSVSVTICDAGREAVLDQMIALLSRTGFVRDKDLLKRDILTREALGSVEVAPGVAMPHSRSDGVSGFCAALGVSEKKQIFLLTAWPSVSYKELKTLAAFIELFQDEAKKRELLEAKDAAELFERIKAGVQI